jgi:hypothetical protein
MARATRIEPAYRVSIPGVLLPKQNETNGPNTWHEFLIDTDELMELYAAIKSHLGLS